MVKIDGRPVYVRGLRAWDAELEGKQVEVTGTLQTRAPTGSRGPDEMPRHGFGDETLVLDEAEWAVA